MQLGRAEEKSDSYMLVEDVQRSWETEKGSGSQRVIGMDEKVWLVQSRWRGTGRFILQRNSNVRLQPLQS